MRTKVKHIVLLLPLLLALAGGCATKALWENQGLEACKEPADHLNLRLFERESPADFLVVYDESSERTPSVRPRAFWLNENKSRVEDQRLGPHFTQPAASRGLRPIPVLYEPLPAGATLSPGLCAVVATNKQMFTLYQSGRSIASHTLPIYNDGKGRLAKIALTPVAVTADLSIVGAVVAYWCAGGSDRTPPRRADGGPYD